jgi:hypothetical protein
VLPHVRPVGSRRRHTKGQAPGAKAKRKTGVLSGVVAGVHVLLCSGATLVLCLQINQNAGAGCPASLVAARCSLSPVVCRCRLSPPPPPPACRSPSPSPQKEAPGPGPLLRYNKAKKPAWSVCGAPTPVFPSSCLPAPGTPHSSLLHLDVAVLIQTLQVESVVLRNDIVVVSHLVVRLDLQFQLQLKL